MVRFGLHLTLRSGREALVRLLVTMAAVGLGVGLLLSVTAMYHAYQSTVDKACWQCTDASSRTGTLLWNYGQDMYAGKTIDRLDVATLSAAAPILPGLARMPSAGQFYASPAMAALLRTAPADELGNRFGGTLAGEIGPAALESPDQLVIVVGDEPTTLAALPHTLRLSQIDTTPRGLSTSSFYRFGFALGGVALLVPMLVLIGTATRIAAARREERFAALRLVGATRYQISAVASIDAVLGAVAGAVVGIGVYALIHPLLADLPLLGFRFFAAGITPTGWGYAIALVLVPLAATAVSLMSLLRVGISPLGVARRVTPPAPRLWRILPLLIGLGLFCIPLLSNPTAERKSPGLAVLSLAVVMLGLMIAGPWLTMQATRALARSTGGGSGLLAARRLADNPRAAFRTVSGLVLAVLIGTALASIVPAAIAAQNTSQDGALKNVLRVGFDSTTAPVAKDPYPGGLPPATAATLLAKISAIAGTHPMPVYQQASGEIPPPIPGSPLYPQSVIGCADLRQLSALGACRPGANAVLADTGALYTDNLAALNRQLPLVTAASTTSDDNLAQLPMTDLIVTVDGPATLEKVRTVLSGYAAAIDPDETPMTFGEVGQIRAKLYLEIQRIVTILAAVTMLIAGCSLAVAVSGSLIERKRPFTLMRVSGVSIGTLYRAVLLETVVPLIIATLVAAAVGLGLAYPIARALAPTRHVLVLPQPSYYLTLGASLLFAAAVILACLPLLGRITHTDNARFE